MARAGCAEKVTSKNATSNEKSSELIKGVGVVRASDFFYVFSVREEGKGIV